MTDGYVNLFRSADPWHQKINGSVRVWVPDGPLPDGRWVVSAGQKPPDVLEAAKKYLRQLAAKGQPMLGCTSYVQRCLGIGYNDAAVIIHRLELEGWVSLIDAMGGRYLTEKYEPRLSRQAILDVDPRNADAYRVSVMGGLERNEVALFCGNGALELAIDYASTCFDSWADPLDLCAALK